MAPLRIQACFLSGVMTSGRSLHVDPEDGAHEDCLARQSLQMTLAALVAGINEAPNE